MAEVIHFPIQPRQTPRKLAQDAEYFRHARQQIRTAALGVLATGSVAAMCMIMAYVFFITACSVSSVVFFICAGIMALLSGGFVRWGLSERKEYVFWRERYRYAQHRRAGAANPPSPHPRNVYRSYREDHRPVYF
jgi:hypothetical protein